MSAIDDLRERERIDEDLSPAETAILSLWELDGYENLAGEAATELHALRAQLAESEAARERVVKLADEWTQRIKYKIGGTEYEAIKENVLEECADELRAALASSTQQDQGG